MRVAGPALLVGALGIASIAFGATEADWAAFRADVEAKCLEAAAPLFESAVAIVDPFGSPSFGLALLRGKARGAEVAISAICVYDKVTQTVEIGGELPPAEAPPPAPPATTPMPMTPVPAAP